MELKLLLLSTAGRLGNIGCACNGTTSLIPYTNSSIILINRGWVPTARMDAETRKEGQVDHMTSGDTQHIAIANID